MFLEVEKPKFRDLIGGRSFKGKITPPVLKEDVLRGVKIVGSGKAAVSLIIEYLREKKVIKNKLDEMIVADWIGFDVYKQLNSFVFPSKKFSGRSRIIFVYHQYGFPQDMDKIMEFARERKLIVIEDCANVLDSYYKGKKLGTIGDFAIYSFSKWFFCFALGGVRANPQLKDFDDFTDELLSRTPFGFTAGKDIVKFFTERSRFSKNKFFKKIARIFLLMSYSLYGDALKASKPAKNLLNLKLENEIKVRKERYRKFLEETEGLGICDHLEKEGITPYVIPVHCNDLKNEELVKNFRSMGFITGVYHFDMNRNLLNPKFEKCVWIPCHSGISDEDFLAITEMVVKTVKN